MCVCARLCSGLLRPSCLLPRVHTAAAAFASMQQQAAAHRGLSWVSGLCPGKSDKTGGRLHPGQAGERLLEQRPRVCQERSWRGDCDCLRFGGQLRPSCPLPRAHMSAARVGRAWVSGFCQGKGVRTGGRLHPRQAGERLLKQRPHAMTKGQSATRSWFLCASRLVAGFVRSRSVSHCTV